MVWCEAQTEVYYCLGLARTSVLVERLAGALMTARIRQCLCGAPAVREFIEFPYQTRKSWSRERRVIGKAEVMRAGDNPRFVVTSLPAEGFADDAEPTRFTPARRYEECYCARGRAGEPAQTTGPGSAGRPALHPSSGQQPTAAVVEHAGLPALGTDAGRGPGGHRIGASHRGQPPREALESRGSGADQCPPGVCAVEQRLALAGDL